jgi:hypothetical protein
MAYDFNGTNQYISAGSAPVAAVPLTMACWFSVDNTTANHTLISLSSTLGTFNNYFRIRAAGAVAGDPLQATCAQDSTESVATSTSAFSSGTFHHAAGVFSSNTSRTVYLDGGNSATSTENISPLNINSSQIAAVFLRGINAFSGFTDGRIAEVGIWSAALTAAEVASLAKGMTCDKVRPQNLVFYAPLVRDLQDVRGGLTITNNNAATVATHPRVYA